MNIKDTLLAYILTLFYSLIMLCNFALRYLKNPFTSPWTQKLRLVPPAELTDPKYGVHKYVKVNNIKLHYVESGDPSKPLMLFVHGFPEFWYTWRHQILEFKKDYWCIAVDMRGYGDSEKPEDTASYKLNLLIDDLRELVKHLGREKFILVSHDWGSIVSAKFRDTYPEMLSGVILLGGSSIESIRTCLKFNPEQRKKSWYVFFFQMPVLPEMALTLNDMEVFNEMIVPGKDSVTSQDLEIYRFLFGKPSAFTPPVNYYRANFSMENSDKKLCEKNVPFFAALAANDKYLDKELMEILKKEYKHIETTILDNCSHFIQMEEPERVNKLIRDFLRKHNL